MAEQDGALSRDIGAGEQGKKLSFMNSANIIVPMTQWKTRGSIFVRQLWI